MRLPIGELLVRERVLTREQCEQVLQRQHATHRPFGELAEQMFGVESSAVEKAWAEQYAATTRWVDPRTERIDPAVREMVTRRQAWQFRVLPMGYDGSELMVCTLQESLVRAMNFAARQIPIQCYFVLATPDALAGALGVYYPMDGMGVGDLVGPMPNLRRKAG